MLYTLNNNYVLRQELNDCYRLYNKKTLRSYTISYKLFFILEQFRKQSYSLEHLIEEFNVRNIDLSDFYHFIEKDEFFDLLVMANNFKGPFVKYKISKDLSSYTAYSPERVDFLITKHCNLACKHCFEGSSPSFEVKRISSSDTDRILSQFEAANIQTLKITGGEPFSHPDIDNFLFKAIQCHFETIILTNALLLNKQRIDMIKKGHIQLGISLDGMTSDTHDFIRGKGAFDKLIRILKILSLEDIKFSITCTINKKNLCQIDEIIDEHCTKLTKVTIPNSVVSLGWFAFHECSSLTRIVIPNHVATISEFAFADCSLLTNVTLGSGVTSIEGSAFHNTPIRQLRCYAVVPPKLPGVVNGSFSADLIKGATLYVPAGTGMAYAESDWKIYFENIVEMEE